MLRLEEELWNENNLAVEFSDENVEEVSENICGQQYSNDDDEDKDIGSDIGDWATQLKISMVALAALLLILKKFNFKLPKDPCTLLKTPTNISLQSLSGGDYFYCGIKKTICSLLSSLNKKPLNLSTPHLNLQVNVDGLPIFKSNKMQLWPILGLLEEFRNLGVFVIALFSGTKKNIFARLSG